MTQNARFDFVLCMIVGIQLVPFRQISLSCFPAWVTKFVDLISIPRLAQKISPLLHIVQTTVFGFKFCSSNMEYLFSGDSKS